MPYQYIQFYCTCFMVFLKVLSEDIAKSIAISIQYRNIWASQVTLVGKNPPGNSIDSKRGKFDPWVGKIPCKKAWQLQYSCLENPMDRGVWQATVYMVIQSLTRLSDLAHIHVAISILLIGTESFPERQWHPTPVLLPGKSHERQSLVGCSPWGPTESDTTEVTQQQH